ncbi:MAG: hypothetical protein C4527_10350 [Candidatus Omnitrophota bacterium]|jgi:hypothetical protein|nr:MAG: hypothetical protein C4527_10350 [Candidatus Omnitrophota bacterium]
MLPVNLLGDAAAAEAMVAQATKTQHADQVSHDRLFDRYLYLSREEIRLAVQPPSFPASCRQLSVQDYRLPFQKRQQNKKQKNEQRKFALQPLLFSLETDRVASEYGKRYTELDMGENIDLTV